MKNINLEQILMVASFFGVAYSPYYCIIFIAIVANNITLMYKSHNERKAIEQELRSELLKVQLLSAQVEELQSSINNVRAAVSLGGRR